MSRKSGIGNWRRCGLSLDRFGKAEQRQSGKGLFKWVDYAQLRRQVRICPFNDWRIKLTLFTNNSGQFCLFVFKENDNNTG